MRPRKNPQQSKRGRPSEYGLECFVAALVDFWVDDAHQRFTLDYHKGAPISRAAQFLIDALAPLDEVPDRAVITAARRIQRERRAHKK